MGTASLKNASGFIGPFLTRLRRRSTIPIVGFLALFLVLVSAQAAENIEIPNDGIKVYSKSDIGSPVVGILKKGAIVPAATNPVGNFKKVMITVGGQKKIGYISLYDMKGPIKVVQPQALIAARPSPAPVANASPAPLQPLPPPGQHRAAQRVVKRAAYIGMHNRTAIGLILGLAYQYQGARQYTDSTGSSSNVGVLTGSMLQYGLAGNFPLGFNTALAPYIIYKPISVTGSATPSAGVGTAASAIVLQQNYLSLGAQLKFYPSSYGSFWWGLGAQLDHATSGSLQIGTAAPITSQQGDLPNLFMLYGSLGINLGITKSIFLIPELRLGALVNTTPPIYEASGDLTFDFAF